MKWIVLIYTERDLGAQIKIGGYPWVGTDEVRTQNVIGFFISILSGSFFLNIFKYLWNFLETIFSTIPISIKSFYFSSFSSTILAVFIFFSTIGFLDFFPFLSFPLFSSFSFSPFTLAILASSSQSFTAFYTLLGILSFISPQFSNQSQSYSMLVIVFLILHSTFDLLLHLFLFSLCVLYKIVF